MTLRTMLIGCAAIALLAGATAAQAAMKDPDQVKKALGTLNRVVDHTGRLIMAKNYPHLVHENDEFKEGAAALEKDIAGEPVDFRAKVESLLQRAEADSQSLADAATAHGDSKLGMIHAALADSVKALLITFPDSVQPPPPSQTKEKQEG